MAFVQRDSTRTLAVLATLAAAAALAVAYTLEIWGELVPCALCLVERWPYRIVIVLGLLSAVAPRRFAWVLLFLAAACLLTGAAVAAVHVGVEMGWWPSPMPECAAPRFGGGSITDRLASMPARPAKPCDEATFLIPGIKLSFAAMNLLFALGFCATLAIFLWRSRLRPALGWRNR